MTDKTSGVTAAAASSKSPQSRQRRPVGGIHLGKTSTVEAKRLAAAILEVLAGVRTTADAASAVGLSLVRYYQVEARALAGLLLACEPRAPGRQHTAERELHSLRRDNQRLQREVARQQALVRLGQRSLGLAAVAPPVSSKVNGKKTRKRRPVSRALQVAARLDTGPVTPLPAMDSLQKPE
jgi:hypothetical protein